MLTGTTESAKRGVMKTLLCALVGLSGMAAAEDMPRGAFKSSQFNEAREAAKAQGKALIYIETDSKTTCPKTEWGTAEAYSALKRDYVLVIEDDSDPANVDVKEMNSAIIKTSKIGNFTPRVTVVNPDKLEFITGTDYSNMSKDKRWAKKLDETVAASLKPATAETSEPAAAKTAELRDWTNTEGKTIRATLIEKKETVVSLKLENGKVVDYPIDKLSAESKAAL
jgi:hypothetical protein